MNPSAILPRLVDRSRVIARFTTVLQSLPVDRAWQVEVREHKPKRSDQQNRYLWGVVYKALTDALPGWTAEDVHEYMLGECYGWETIEGMGRKRLRPLRRSSRLNKQEFADYVAFIQRKAAEHGVFIPDPEGGL